MSIPFNDPASSSGIEFEPLKGSLLLFTVHTVEKGVKTSFGDKDAVKADVVVIDGDKKGESHDGTLIFPAVLVSQLAPSAGGGMVLGRLGQGNAKPGQKPPWTLSAATDEDKAAGVAYLNWKQSQQITQPAAAEPTQQSMADAGKPW